MPSQKKTAGNHWRGTGTVLIVDDEQSVLMMIAQMVEMLGFTALRSRDGADGIEIFRTHVREIVLVLLDITMPQLSGEQVFHEICRIKPDARVFFMSGYMEEDTIGGISGKGIAGFIQKPFALSDLREKIKAALG